MGEMGCALSDGSAGHAIEPHDCLIGTAVAHYMRLLRTFARLVRGNRYLSLYNRDRLPIVRPKSCHQHPFEGAKLQAKITSILSRKTMCSGEELKDWTRLLLSCAAHRAESFNFVLKSLPENIRRQKIVYDIQLCLLGHQIRHWKRLGVQPASLSQVDDEFRSISALCAETTVGFATYFLYMDAHCSARNLCTVWEVFKKMPKATADDFTHLIMLYNALGESSRCQTLLTCVENMKLPMSNSAAMKLAVFLAKNTPASPTRHKLVESLVFKRVRSEPNRVYGHAAQALLLVSNDPFDTFNKLIQPSSFTVSILFKRLIDLCRFNEVLQTLNEFGERFPLGYHDYSVILSKLGQARQFRLALRFCSIEQPSAHVITSLIASAAKCNQQEFARMFLSYWPLQVPMDTISLTAVLGARIFDLSQGEFRALNEREADGMLYSRLLYACQTEEEISRVWLTLIDRNIEPDVFANIGLFDSISNLPETDKFRREKLHATLLSHAVSHMKIRNFEWPALLDSTIVAAARSEAIAAQKSAYQLLRKFNMIPTSFAVSEMVRTIYGLSGAIEALSFLDQVEKDVNRTFPSPRFTILRLAALDKDVHLVSLICDNMILLGITPNLHTWNSLLILYSRLDDLQRCKEVFERMRSHAKLSPNMESWTALLLVCARSRLEQQCTTILNFMRDSHLSLPSSAINTLEANFGSLWLYDNTKQWVSSPQPLNSTEAELCPSRLQVIRDIIEAPWILETAPRNLQL